MIEGELDATPAIYQFFESESDKESVIVSEPCYHSSFFEEEGRG